MQPALSVAKKFQDKRTKGFTLLEILIVMAIISVLLYMLIQSIAIFRRNVELQQASDQLITGISQTNNFAGNNILPNDYNVSNTEVYGYSLNFQSNNLIRRVCSKHSSGTFWTCDSTTAENILDDILQNVRINSNDCEGVLFINLSGDIKIGNHGNFDSDGVCEVEISHTEDERVFRKIIFDGAKNNYELKFGN